MTTDLASYITRMPKVELHVHLAGGIQPKLLLRLARRNHIDLPADTVEGLQQWYAFRDFPHFVDIYVAITRCISTAADFELVATEFLHDQLLQNVQHTEITHTISTPWNLHGISFDDQLAAINRSRDAITREHGITASLIIDIAREQTPAQGLMIADWVIANHGSGVDALGLGGYEVGHPPEKHARAFERARNKGVPCILHAGETAGPESIRGAIRVADSKRIGHGVRAIEDPSLMAYLKATQIPLEVCPGSNICLGVYPSLAEHPVQRLIAAGLCVTLNSDDPPMFNTTLTDEYLRCTAQFGWDKPVLRTLNLAAARAALVCPERKTALTKLIEDFEP